MLSASPPPAPATALIGRATEVEDVLDLLGRARLVTLTGPPGVGKTRLALAVCADRDDVSWVDLAPIRDPLQVRAELARAARPEGDDHATDRLVVLDNCEHLLDSDLAGQLADLLRSTARLQVLATSRERLRLATEREYAVPPLPMPSADDGRRPGPAAGQPGRGAPPRPGAAGRPAHAEHRPCAGRDLRRPGRAAAGDRAGRRAAAGVHPERARVPARPADERADQRTPATLPPGTATCGPPSPGATACSPSATAGRLPPAVGLPRRSGTCESAAAVCCRARRPRRGRVAAGQEPGPPRRGRADGEARFAMLVSLREYAAEQLDEAGRGAGHPRPPRALVRQSRPGVGGDASAPPPRPTPWPQLAALRADLRAGPGPCPGHRRGATGRLAGRGAGLVRLHPRCPGGGRGAAG